jgi:hypothetical protein
LQPARQPDSESNTYWCDGDGEKPVDAMEIAAVIYVGTMLAFATIFLVGFFRYRRRVWPYSKYALIPAVILIVVEATILLLSPEGVTGVDVAFATCMTLIAFGKLILFGSVGMHCAASIGGKHAPLMRSLFARRAHLAAGPARGMLFWAPAIAAGGVVYSCTLFTLVPVRASDAVRELMESSSTTLALAMQSSFLSALVMFEFALSEEVVFRLGIQSYLAHVFKLRGNNYWIAIILTTTLWSVAHVYTLEPNWAKIAQVFPFGVALGVLFRKYGVETCVAAHGLFNLVLLFLAPSLIEM